MSEFDSFDDTGDTSDAGIETSDDAFFDDFEFDNTDVGLDISEPAEFDDIGDVAQIDEESFDDIPAFDDVIVDELPDEIVPFEDEDDEAFEGRALTLTRDPEELRETGDSNIEDIIDVLRDDYHDKGYADGEELDTFLQQEREALQQEFDHDAFHYGEDISPPTENMDEPIDATNIEEEYIEAPDIADDITSVNIIDGLDMPEPDDNEDSPDDIAIDTEDDTTDELVDYDAVYEGLDEYDFDGKDCNEDPERLDDILGDFQQDTWENAEFEEQKERVESLSEYINETLSLGNPPAIEYYNRPEEGDYGGYNASTNVLQINEYMLHHSREAADTIAHELWHAYQHERAMNPQSDKDHMYQYGFENYVRPEDDFDGYQSQLVESEARAFADQIKGKIA